MTEINWSALKSFDGAELKSHLFAVFQQLAVSIQESDSDEPSILSAVPRLAELIAERPQLQTYTELLNTLARSVGLWNYIDPQTADHREAIIADAVNIPELGAITLHREQVEALNILLSGRNLILSAPTSFGKSVLIDVLLLSGKYNRIAIVLPTIALLDEFRRRLVSRFGNAFDILMHHSEGATKEKVIFLGTQERLINRSDLGTLDLAVVDEFYKLDPDRQDDRSMTLNAAVYQLLKTSKQFFFLGPNIENVRFSPHNKWRFEFLQTRFSTVAVDTFDLKNVPDRDTRLAQEAYTRDNWPALIFVKSPDKANELSRDLFQAHDAVGSAGGLAEWISENYGDRWELAKAVQGGLGVHHGRIPRALASRFVRLFNDRKLPILVCTSTLIEGVNTAAKSVMIYDKTINRAAYDFFTFSNIRGRAGRLGQHHVGRVYLFHAAPAEEGVDVTPPLFGDLDKVADEMVVHISGDDSNEVIGKRVQQLTYRLGLTWEEMKQLSSLGLDTVAAVKDAVSRAIKDGTNLAWSGRPDYNDIRAIAEIICTVKRPRDFGVKTANQLTMYLNQLRQTHSMRDFFLWHSGSFRGAADTFDNVFKFLRACEYSLPELFACVEIFVRKDGTRADYSLFTAEMPRWFRPEPLKILEEQGVPIQISERFLLPDESVSSLSARLRQLADNDDQRLTQIERDWVIDALPSLLT